jgi:hypothetical protein
VADWGWSRVPGPEYGELTLNPGLHALLHDPMHERLQTRPDRRSSVGLEGGGSVTTRLRDA